MQVFIRALSARPTAGPVNQVLWEAKQVSGKTCSFYMYSYIIVRIIPTSLWASTTRTAVRVYNDSIYMTSREYTTVYT